MRRSFVPALESPGVSIRGASLCSRNPKGNMATQLNQVQSSNWHFG
jgi:hypothetical protein